MPRKKTRKTMTTKKPAVQKRAAKTNMRSGTEAMEKDFRDIPSKLLSQCRKEIQALSQQEKKLKSALTKAQAQRKTAKNKSTKAIEKMINDLNKQLETNKLQAKSLTSRQSKFTAIAKQLDQFAKQWDLKERKAEKAAAKIAAAKAAAKARKKTAKKKTRANAANQIQDLETQIEFPADMTTEANETVMEEEAV